MLPGQALSLRHTGQGKNKLCAHPFGGDGVNMLPVGSDDLLDNGQAQTGSPLVLAPGEIGFVKALPDFCDAVPGNAGPFILDGNKDLFMPESGLNGNFRFVGAEFDSVVQQIVEDLLDFTHICQDELFPGIKEQLYGDMAFPASSLKRGNRILDYFIDINLISIK